MGRGQANSLSVGVETSLVPVVVMSWMMTSSSSQVLVAIFFPSFQVQEGISQGQPGFQWPDGQLADVTFFFSLQCSQGLTIAGLWSLILNW